MMMGLSSKNMSEYIKVVVKSKIVGHQALLSGKGFWMKCTLHPVLLQIPKKFLPGYDSCFQTYLMQEIQKYDLN